MRIIDKIQDFYDYLQDPTDTLVFDRRNSFLLTKEKFRTAISYKGHWDRDSKYRFVLLQCSAYFWLFLVTMTETDSFGNATEYTIELLDTWKNYDKPNELLKLDVISFFHTYKMYDYKIRDYKVNLIKENIKDFKDAIKHNDFEIEVSLNKHTKVTDHKGKFKTEEQNLPILKACGIGNIVDPQEIFCAIEEYFSIEKTKSETTEAKGATNDDKIIMHGFDTKTSFRGKR